MVTMADLDALALALPETTKVVSDDGRPAYKAHDKMFVGHRGPRPDAIDPDTGERLDDVLIFRVENLEVKEIILADDRGIYRIRHRWPAVITCRGAADFVKPFRGSTTKPTRGLEPRTPSLRVKNRAWNGVHRCPKGSTKYSQKRDLFIFRRGHQ